MSVTIIPMEDAGSLGQFFFTVSLEGVNYQFDMKYNEREDAWYFDMADINGNVIRSGVKVVSNWPLIRLLRALPRPLGEIFPIDTRAHPLDPGLNDLGVNVVFGYIEQDSLI